MTPEGIVGPTVTVLRDRGTQHGGAHLRIPTSLRQRSIGLLARLWRRTSPGYVAACVTAWIAVRSWFSPGRFVAAGDIGPFLRDGLEQDLWTSWGYGVSGAGSATAEVARLPEYLVYRTVIETGGTAMAAQQLFYFLVLFGASAGAVFAVRQVVDGRCAHVAVAVLAVANPLMAVNLPNPLVPVAVGTLGFVLGALIRASRGEGSVVLTVMATLPMAYLSINPPTVAVVAGATLVGAAVALVRGGAPTRRLLAIAGPVGLAVHAWWIVPAAVLHATGGGAELAAVTDPEAWAWTHVNNSLANVATLTAHWGWGLHEYLPFSRDHDEYPLTAMRWALPVLVVLAPLAARTRRSTRFAYGALATAAVTILVAKGLHGPWAGLNRTLYEVPGMWLLREPMSKLGPILLLAYLIGVAITIDGVTSRAGSMLHRRNWRAPGIASIVVLVVAAVSFGSPVLTGGVAPDDRTPLPSSRVAVPEGWSLVAAQVNGDRTEGKALVLPSLSFYQATTTWGFHGVATLPRDLFTRPTLLNLPGGYFADERSVRELVGVVEHGRSPVQIGRALDALGVSHVVVRTDLSDAQAVAPVADTDALVSRLRSTGLFPSSEDHGVAMVFGVSRPRSGPRVHRGVARSSDAGTDAAGMASLVVAATSDAAIVPPDRSSDSTAVLLEPSSGRTVHTVLVERPGGTSRIGLHSVVGRSFSVQPTAGRVKLRDQVAITIDGRRATLGDIVLEAPGASVPPGLLVGGRLVPIGTGSVLDVAAGETVAALGMSNAGEPVTGWGDLGNCARVDERQPSIAGHADGSDVELAAPAHSACMEAVLPLTGLALLELSMEVREGAGRVCVWSDEEARCLWEHRSSSPTLDPVPVSVPIDLPRDTRLFVYADASERPASVRFTDVRVRALRPGTRELVPTDVEYTTALDAERLEIAVTGTAPFRVLPPSQVGNCHDRGQATLDRQWDGRTVRLTAVDGSACVFRPVRPLTPGLPFEISFTYRTEHGGGRWCLWVDGADRCVNHEQVLAPTESWRQHRSTVVLEDETEARLYLYADHDGSSPPVVTEYRDVDVAPSLPLTVSVTSGDEQPLGEVLAARGGGDRWTFDLLPAEGPTIVGLPDSSHDGWYLDGLPAGASAEPVTLDGFRQGWIIDGLGHEPLTLTAHFRPSSWTHMATWMSAITVLGLIGAAAAVPFMSRVPHRPSLLSGRPGSR